MTPIRMYIPSDLFELRDLLGSMLISAPKFEDKTGYLAFLNLDYVFRQLSAGLEVNKVRLGEERFEELRRLSEQIRALFEANPEDKTGETHQGRLIIHTMLDILQEARRNS